VRDPKGLLYICDLMQQNMQRL